MSTRAERRRAEKREKRKVTLYCRFPHCVSSIRRLCMDEEVHWQACPRPLMDESQREAKDRILEIEHAVEWDAVTCKDIPGEHPFQEQRYESWGVEPELCPSCGKIPDIIEETPHCYRCGEETEELSLHEYVPEFSPTEKMQEYICDKCRREKVSR